MDRSYLQLVVSIAPCTRIGKRVAVPNPGWSKE